MNNNINYGRKRKGIINELNSKLAEWIGTITDEAVRAAAKKDTIVTGGSIASMLLGEKVNDYDVYFRTKATTKLIAQYYAKKFVSLHPDCIEPIVEDIDGRIKIKIQSSGVLEETHTPFDQDEAVEVIEDETKEKYRPVFLSANAITLSHKMQLIIRFYGSPDQIHNSFDFVHAKSYYDYVERNLVIPAEAMESLLCRALSYKGSLYPICSIFRAKKFIERGWRISAGDLLKIMWQISELDLTDAAVLEEQLTGVDQTYMRHLVEALKDVDKDKINSTYVASIIDKIFN